VFCVSKTVVFETERDHAGIPDDAPLTNSGGGLS
jgi:hypothetical protein